MEGLREGVSGGEEMCAGGARGLEKGARAGFEPALELDCDAGYDDQGCLSKTIRNFVCNEAVLFARSNEILNALTRPKSSCRRFS